MRRNVDRLTFTAMGAFALCLLFTFVPARAGGVEDGVADIQQEWAQINYRRPAAERQAAFEALATRAHELTVANPERSEPRVWEGIVLSSLAGEKGGLGGLGLAKRAKALYEDAIRIDGNVLDGSAYNSLGVLYYKVPGWPVGFGDKHKAQELLKKALAINPSGIDPNYFYADYLVQTGSGADAVPYLERALAAPPRAGRQLADEGRRGEARQLLERARAH